MTPKCKTANSTTLIIERKKQIAEPVLNGNEKDIHVAGGDHKGIIINKQMTGKYYKLSFMIIQKSQLCSVTRK